MPGAPDPYQTLGVSRSASDAELRSAYRRLVLLHHPDHNGGSAESTRRFEQIQDAYAAVRRLRQAPGGGDRVRARPASAGAGAGTAPGAGSDPGVESRLAAMERELRAAREARERTAREAADAAREARRAAEAARRAERQALRDLREAARAGGSERPTDEELGYVSTDDSFTKILDDLASELSGRVGEAKDSPTGRRVSDLIDELGSKLRGEPPPDRRD
jgi:curved DNA-binding protein CbpA